CVMKKQKHMARQKKGTCASTTETHRGNRAHRHMTRLYSGGIPGTLFLQLGASVGVTVTVLLPIHSARIVRTLACFFITHTERPARGPRGRQQYDLP